MRAIATKFCLVLLGLSFSCTDSKSRKVYTYDTSQFRIFYYVKSQDTLLNIKQVNDPNPKLFLSPDELEIIEQSIDSAIISVNKVAEGHFNLWREFNKDDTLNPREFKPRIKSEYKRQYVAEFDKLNGDKCVMINCFSSKGDLGYWDTYFIDALGGGSNHFSFEVNLSKNTLSKVYVNAPM
jgi:hypothetical protein